MTVDRSQMDSSRLQHISPQQWQTIWQERGWINREVKTEDPDFIDPRGEEAYQRRFAEAFKENRVPNPSFFTNSPSAQEYIRNRDKRLFPGSFQDPKAQVPNPNFHHSIRSPDASQTPNNANSPGSSGGQDPSSPIGEPITNGHHPSDQQAIGKTAWPSQRGTNGPLEPQVGPAGPPRMLR